MLFSSATTSYLGMLNEIYKLIYYCGYEEYFMSELNAKRFTWGKKNEFIFVLSNIEMKQFLKKQQDNSGHT